jgi:hypothetical protein
MAEICVSGSGFGIRTRIQEDNNDPDPESMNPDPKLWLNGRNLCKFRSAVLSLIANIGQVTSVVEPEP